MNSSKTILINIVGPTAVGKTALAILIAKHFKTEIISSDSRQFYKEVSIGTAKPSIAELEAIPHHFIDTLSVTETYSAGDFERDALHTLGILFKQHPVVVMVGGSGLYIKAVTEGLDALPAANEDLRIALHALLEEKGIKALAERLLLANPTLYEKTPKDNPQRLMRAIEIAEGDVIEKSKAKRDFTTISIGINLPREQLYTRIERRVDAMFEAGLLDEVKRMVPFKTNYAMQTVGYKELFAHLDGEYGIEKAKELIKQHTRNYAKRQLTWFKRDASIKWFEPSQEEEIIQYQITQIGL